MMRLGRYAMGRSGRSPSAGRSQSPARENCEDGYGKMDSQQSFASLSSDRKRELLGNTRRVSVVQRKRQSVWVAAQDGSLEDDCSKAAILLQQAKEMAAEDAQLEAAEEGKSSAPLIALVAHENMEALMVTFIKEYKDMLKEFRLMGTETTCKTLRGVGLEPEDMFVVSGPLGGDQALGYFITTGEVRGMFFFRDPLSAHAHAADIAALSRLADVYQIYFASNYRSAAGILKNMHRNYMMAKNGIMDYAGSVRVPKGMSHDLGQHVTENYKTTRAGVVANALK